MTNIFNKTTDTSELKEVSVVHSHHIIMGDFEDSFAEYWFAKILNPKPAQKKIRVK